MSGWWHTFNLSTRFEEQMNEVHGKGHTEISNIQTLLETVYFMQIVN